ncbi:MAG: hypothetical protein AVDCRST_MAG49-1578 [uncultured Thermomicrobiales bacterium]|uniref:Uncharacterized protein n=1 Tax=uncultured Thermomicrobiales bacterium TaxID=1645740 RepID=A0A6J4UFY7_9BACT|nr:MAG: hypothetical protein AVDCRST_MAG49-1578 [uncultured Thermomicrobiales bacterium]
MRPDMGVRERPDDEAASPGEPALRGPRGGTSVR